MKVKFINEISNNDKVINKFTSDLKYILRDILIHMTKKSQINNAVYIGKYL